MTIVNKFSIRHNFFALLKLINAWHLKFFSNNNDQFKDGGSAG